MEGLPPRVLSVNGDVAEKAAHGHGRSAAFKRTKLRGSAQPRGDGRQAAPTHQVSYSLSIGFCHRASRYRALPPHLISTAPSALAPLNAALTYSFTHTHTHVCFYFILRNLHPSLLCLLTPWAPNGAYRPQTRKNQRH